MNSSIHHCIHQSFYPPIMHPSTNLYIHSIIYQPINPLIHAFMFASIISSHPACIHHSNIAFIHHSFHPSTNQPIHPFIHPSYTSIHDSMPPCMHSSLHHFIHPCSPLSADPKWPGWWRRWAYWCRGSRNPSLQAQAPDWAQGSWRGARGSRQHGHAFDLRPQQPAWRRPAGSGTLPWSLARRRRTVWRTQRPNRIR